MNRRYDESLAQLQKTAEIDPNFQRVHTGFSFIYRMKGDFAATVEESAKVQELAGNAKNARLTREAFAKGDGKHICS